jgi:hypothetical protein
MLQLMKVTVYQQQKQYSQSKLILINQVITGIIAGSISGEAEALKW